MIKYKLRPFLQKIFIFSTKVQHDIKVNDKRVTYITKHNLHHNS